MLNSLLNKRLSIILGFALTQIYAVIILLFGNLWVIPTLLLYLNIN